MELPDIEQEERKDGMVKWYDAEAETPTEDGYIWVKRQGKEKPEMAQFDTSANSYGLYYQPDGMLDFSYEQYGDVVYWTHLEPPEFYD